MRTGVKRALIGVVAVLGLASAAFAGWVYTQTSAFDASMAKVWDVPVPNVTRSSDPAVIARGKHLAESVAACATRDCHGADLAGGRTLELGPLGKLTGPNVTPAGISAAYTDGELVRLVKHGIKKDGRSLRFMPSQDFAWLPEADVLAIVSHLRTVPPVEKANGIMQVNAFAKVLDRKGMFVMDVARALHDDRGHGVEQVPAPEPTAAYGKFLGRLCTGCHGEHLSGGKIPGTPPSVPIPPNLTPDPTGMKGWTYDDFVALLSRGLRKNGKQLDPFMPYEAFGKMDDTEKKALWEYLQSLPPTPLGNR